MIKSLSNINSRFLWSFRKLSHPFYLSAPILDIGSGGNPHPYADILLEKYIDDAHRLHSIKIDRPIVLADAEKMPFKNRSFGYSFAFHVLEHLKNPAQFMRELERVSLAGYIETPNSLYERLIPLNVHALEVSKINDILVIYKKHSANNNDYLGDLNILTSDARWNNLFLSNPKLFHVCHRWEGHINFKILNDDQNQDWFDFLSPGLQGFDNSSNVREVRDSMPKGRRRFVDSLRLLRRRKFDLNDILACPICESDLNFKNSHYKCKNIACAAEFKTQPYPDFNYPL